MFVAGVRRELTDSRQWTEVRLLYIYLRHDTLTSAWEGSAVRGAGEPERATTERAGRGVGRRGTNVRTLRRQILCFTGPIS